MISRLLSLGFLGCIYTFLGCTSTFFISIHMYVSAGGCTGHVYWSMCNVDVLIRGRTFPHSGARGPQKARPSHVAQPHKAAEGPKRDPSGAGVKWVTRV